MEKENVKQILEEAKKMIGKRKIKICVYNDSYEILKDVDGFNVDGDWLFMYKNIEDGKKEIYIFPISSINQVTVKESEKNE